MPVCPPEVHIELTTTREQDLATSKYKVHYEVTNATGIDMNVFVYKQLLDRDAASGCFKADFEAVATPKSMAEFAVDVPNSGQVFFRKKVVDLEFTSLELAQETDDYIHTDLEQLVLDTQALVNNFQTTTV